MGVLSTLLPTTIVEEEHQYDCDQANLETECVVRGPVAKRLLMNGVSCLASRELHGNI